MITLKIESMKNKILKISVAVYVFPYFVIWSSWLMTGCAFDTGKAFTGDLFLAFTMFVYSIFGYGLFHYVMKKIKRYNPNCSSHNPNSHRSL